MSKHEELAEFALTVVREPIYIREGSCSGPICRAYAVLFGKEYEGRDDPILDSWGAGARSTAMAKAQRAKAQMIADKARELFAPEFGDEEETRL